MSRLATMDRGTTIADELVRERGPLFSFEFFPPGDADGERQLWTTVRKLESLAPDFVSVTYGANGSSRERTVRATDQIARHTTLRTMAHLTCASQPRRQLRQVVGRYADAGVRHVLAIRGDMPGGPLVPWERHPEGLANATELVELVRSLGDFCIGVAAFPDVHPETRDPDLDARLLVAKAEAGASFAITQMCFDPSAYFTMVDRVRSLGCALPIIPGIQPVTNLGQLRRFAELSGQQLPRTITDRFAEVGEDPKKVRRLGVQIGVELSEELLAGGAPGLHYFTQNWSLATRRIYAPGQRRSARQSA